MATATTTKHTSLFSRRVRLVISIICFVVVSGSFTAYALYMYQPQLVTVNDPGISQVPDSSKTSGTATSTTPDDTSSSSSTTTTTPTTTTTSAPAPAPAVVTPASSSDVPSLTPTSSQSSSAASYQSTNWSGYLSTGGSFTSVSGTWVAPNPGATSSTIESGDGTWIGIGGVTTSDLIQVGTENTISASGAVTTDGFYELLPSGAHSTPTLSISPGDTMSASITQTSPNVWAISMTDVTTGRTFSTTVSYASSLSSAEWIQEDPSYTNGSLVLLDNFGTVSFSNATTTVNGTAMSAAASGAAPITMIGQGGAQGHGGTPSAMNGSSFTVTYY